METKTKVIRILGIPESVHNDFKALCNRQRKSMNTKLLELIEQAIRQNRLTIKE